MAKKSAYVNGYLVEQDDSGKINVLHQYDEGEVIGSLREIADAIGFAYNADWNTQEFGRQLVKHANGENTADFEGADEKYRVNILDNKKVESFKFAKDGTTKETLYEIYDGYLRTTNFPEGHKGYLDTDDEETRKNLNTRQVGAIVINAINTLNDFWQWWVDLDDSLKYLLLLQWEPSFDYPLPDYDDWNDNEEFEITDSEFDLYDKEGDMGFYLYDLIFDTEEIYWNNTDVPFYHLEKLAQLPHLKKLVMSGVELGDIPDGIVELAKLAKLETLDLSDNSIDAEELEKLHELHDLQQLNISSNFFDEDCDEVAELREALPNCEIEA
ncbi:hypothetical protein [Lonepinella sp. BR2357]|uniref:hypothetical protein n=1 Tax=Lonepinella sp. BR2357 TaxID=3434549 RepID=UPI003F6DB6FF